MRTDEEKISEEIAREYWAEDFMHPVGTINANGSNVGDVWFSASFTHGDTWRKIEVLNDVIKILETELEESRKQFKKETLNELR